MKICTLAAMWGALALLASPAAAQSPQQLREKMDEISRLMRQSEQLLLEVTRVDRLIDKQEEVVERLKELEPPPSDASPEKRAEYQRRREELERKQQETEEALRKLFEQQAAAGQGAAERLEELLRNLPRQRMRQQGGRGEREKQDKPSPEEMRERERRREEKQQQPSSPRDERTKREKERRGGDKPEDKTASPPAIRRIEAWIARLPPEEQERILRGDYSSVPLEYRKLVEIYTKARAKREAQETEDDR